MKLVTVFATVGSRAARHPFCYRAAGVEHFVLNPVRPLGEVVVEVERLAESLLPQIH